jgi:hypothetical protein
MNFGAYDLKLPRFERFVNVIMVGNFLFMLSLCIGLTVANHFWNEKNSS